MSLLSRREQFVPRRIQLTALLLLTSAAWCQTLEAPCPADPCPGPEATTPPSAGQPPTGNAVSGVLQNVPGPVSGISLPLAVSSETPLSSVVTGSLGVTALYDNNLFSNNAAPLHDVLYTITPSFGLQQVRTRTTLTLNYNGGIAVDQRVDNRSIIYQGGTGELSYALTQHLALRVHEAYAVSSDPFFGLGQTGFVLAPVGPGSPNSFLAVPVATSTTNFSTADLAWELGPHTVAGVSGTYSTLNYRDLPRTFGPTLQLFDTQRRAGRTYIAQQISRRQSIGAEFDVQNLNFTGLGRTITYGAFGFTELVLHQGVKISLYAGPQYAASRYFGVPSSAGPTVAQQSQWSPAAGGTFTWEGSKTALRLGAQRTITDSAGIAGAVRSDNATAELLRYLTPRWAVSLDGAYFDGRGLVDSPVGPLLNLRTLYVSAGIERKLMQNLSLRLRYLRLHQTQSGTLLSPILGDHNRVEFGVYYVFSRPWGG